MPTESLLVTVAVLAVFGFFMTVLGFASFDEGRRGRAPQRRPVLVKTKATSTSRQKSAESES